MFQGDNAQGVVSGSVVYDGPAPTAAGAGVGNTLIFVYAQDAPPPPQGAGRPVTFQVLPRAALFPSGAAAGVHSAPYVISQVPPGKYTVRALLDMDGNFDPFALVRASATLGDVGGGCVDLSVSPPALVTVTVAAGEETQGITVSLSAQAALFLSDAPAFSLAAAAVELHSAATVPTRVRLQSITLSADATLAQSQHVPGASLPGLPVTLAQGGAVDGDGDGFVDVYPRVLLRKMADGDPTGLTDDDGLITIPCVVDPTGLLQAWPPPVGLDAPGVFVPELDVLCLPAALNTQRNPPVRLPKVPAGRYAMLLITAAGQVWRVPNEFGPAANPAGRGLLDAALPTQGAFITVVDEPTPPGSVAGILTAAVQPTGPAWVLVFDAAHPPPPAGSGRPVATARVPHTLFTASGPQYTGAYAVTGLAAGTYLVAALLDQDDNLDARVDVLAQPTAGDLLSAAVPVQVRNLAVPLDLVLGTRVRAHPPVVDSNVAHPTALLGHALSMTLVAGALPQLGASRGPAGVPGFEVSWRHGAPGDGDGDGQPDVWPQTVLQLVQRDPQDQSGVPLQTPVALVSAVDVAPLANALGNTAGEPVAVPQLTLQVLAAAADITNPRQPVPLATVPAGTYALTLLTGEGQFFAPTALDPKLLPTHYLSAASPLPLATPHLPGVLITVPAQTPAAGSVSGVVQVSATSITGPAYVLAFDVQHLGPPDGAGLPVGVTRIPAGAFENSVPVWEAPYVLNALPPGVYVIQALLDQDGDFSLLGSLRTSASAGDVVGAHVAPSHAVEPVEVMGDAVNGVTVVLGRTVPLGPPAFSVAPAFGSVPSRGLGQLVLHSLTNAAPAVGPNGVVSVTPQELAFAVTLRDANGDGIPDDADGDGLPDLYPRVVLQRTADAQGLLPATGADAALIPVMLDPARYLAPLLAGAPAVVTQDLQTLTLPISLLGLGQQLGPLKAGHYATVVATLAGQSWRVPNALAPLVSQAGGGVPSQGVLLTVNAATPPLGAISGALGLPHTLCANVVVVALRSDSGAAAALLPPAALTVVRAVWDAHGLCVTAPVGYHLGDLAPGTYSVQAFADVDGDFNPFVTTMRGASQGDVAGAAREGASLRAVVVEDGPVGGVDVTLAQVVPLEKPAFRYDSSSPLVGSVGGAAVRASLVVAGGMDNALAHVAAGANAFTTSNSNGVVWPKVLVARLNDADPRGLALLEPLELLMAQVDVTRFTGTADARVEVVISPIRVNGLLQPVGAASPGRYSVTVVNAGGQSWTLPNELNPALSAGSAALAGSAGQGAVWTLQ